MLYVESDNDPANATYAANWVLLITRTGFTNWSA